MAITRKWSNEQQREVTYWNETRVCDICFDTLEGKPAAQRYYSGKCKQAGYREAVKIKASNAALLARRNVKGV